MVRFRFGGSVLMRRISVLFFAVVLAVAGCAPQSGGSVPPGTAAAPKVPSGFTLPHAPPAFTPPAPSSITRGNPVRNTSPSAFFNGEASLGNGVYYLALPNGNVFGYYSYLTDPHYIYHFDAGYFYIVDAGDANGGMYMYDFLSRHWWYTSRTFAFPYVYQFVTSSVLYYYPDQNNAGHYTTHPRFFYDFGVNQIMIIPQESPDWTMTDATQTINLTPSGGGSGSVSANGVTIATTWSANNSPGAFSMPSGMATAATHTSPAGFPPITATGVHVVAYLKVSAYPTVTFQQTPAFSITVTSPSTFGGTTCDIYNLQYSNNGTATWSILGLPSEQVSGSNVTFPAVTPPPGNTIDINSPGYGGPGYVGVGCH
jgi:hypothetical protein